MLSDDQCDEGDEHLCACRLVFRCMEGISSEKGLVHHEELLLLISPLVKDQGLLCAHPLACDYAEVAAEGEEPVHFVVLQTIGDKPPFVRPCKVEELVYALRYVHFLHESLVKKDDGRPYPLFQLATLGCTSVCIEIDMEETFPCVRLE